MPLDDEDPLHPGQLAAALARRGRSAPMSDSDDAPRLSALTLAAALALGALLGGGGAFAFMMLAVAWARAWGFPP